MSIDPFPERISPRKWCDRNGTINSAIPLGKLLRLSEYLHDNHGQAEVCLSFDRDASGHCCLTGDVSAKVTMQCQRCLEPTEVDLASTLDTRLASDEGEAERMAASAADPLDKLEIIVCKDGEIDLLSLVEDELIMSLPIVAAHEDPDCNAALNVLQEDGDQLKEQTAQANIKGMDVLEKLKQELKETRQDKESNND